MTAGRAAGDAGDGAARERIPMRTAEAGEGGYDIHAAVVGHAGGERLDLRGVLHEAEAVT